MATLDPQAWVRERTARVVRPARPPEQLRADIVRLLGGLDRWEGTTPSARLTDHRTIDGVAADRVEFATRPGLLASGWFLTPPRPLGRGAILALPGHEASLASFVGLGPDGEYDPAKRSDYHRTFPLQLAQLGHRVLALEQVGFGERRPAARIAEGEAATSCHEDVGAALMLGETVLGWRVWDAMRALDLLAARPGVDPGRLGVAGISGGGTTALFTAALDERVRAAVISGYLNTFADSILAVHHCIDNYVPGLALVADMADVAALIAPRALFVENGREDEIFPVAGFDAAVARLREVYAAAGVPGRFSAHVFPGGHQWDGTGLAELLGRNL
jgi:dienelactone hydrolase